MKKMIMVLCSLSKSDSSLVLVLDVPSSQNTLLWFEDSHIEAFSPSTTKQNCLNFPTY